MKNLKNTILSIISIICLSIAIGIIFTSVNKAFAANTGTKANVKDKSKVIILVGDSRVMHMSYMNASSRKNYVLVFSNGGGIGSINPNGGSRWIGNLLVKAIKKYPKAVVVFALGVNGNGNPSNNYSKTKTYDYYIKHYPDHIFVISSVGGTNKKSGSYSNANVKAFNNKLKKKYLTNNTNTRVFYYDLYDYLASSKLIDPGRSNKGTRDGLHYTNNVYKKWLKDLRRYVNFILATNTNI